MFHRPHLTEVRGNAIVKELKKRWLRTLALRWKKSVYVTIGSTSNYQGTDSESYPNIYRS